MGNACCPNRNNDPPHYRDRLIPEEREREYDRVVTLNNNLNHDLRWARHSRVTLVNQVAELSETIHELTDSKYSSYIALTDANSTKEFLERKVENQQKKLESFHQN